MKVKASAAAAVCTVSLVAAGVAPPANAQAVQPRPMVAVSSQQFSLAGSFNPIAYVGDVLMAGEAVAVTTAAWQSELPLMLVFAARNPDTGEFQAVELIDATSQSAQDLITAVTAIPGVSGAPEIQTVLSGIGQTSDALEGATGSVLETIEPIVSPVRVVYNVVITAARVYTVVMAFPQAFITDLATGGFGLGAIDDVADSVSDFVSALNELATTPAPRPVASVETVDRQLSSAAPMVVDLDPSAKARDAADEPSLALDGVEAPAESPEVALAEETGDPEPEASDEVTEDAAVLDEFAPEGQPSDSDEESATSETQTPDGLADNGSGSPSGESSADHDVSEKAEKQEARRDAAKSAEQAKDAADKAEKSAESKADKDDKPAGDKVDKDDTSSTQSKPDSGASKSDGSDSD